MKCKNIFKNFIFKYLLISAVICWAVWAQIDEDETDDANEMPAIEWNVNSLPTSLISIQQQLARLKANEVSVKQELKNLLKSQRKSTEELTDLKMWKKKVTDRFRRIVANNAHPTNMKPRLELVKNMTLSAWNAYAKYAWGDDVLLTYYRRPRLGRSFDNSGRSILASMSTLWIMELHEQFNQGRQWIEQQFNFTAIDNLMLVHHQVTRYMGGLLSCYALTGDWMFVEKAVAIAEQIEQAFNTSTGIPYRTFNPSTNLTSEETSALSYFGGLYLEHTYLSVVSKNSKHQWIVARMRNNMKTAVKPSGLYQQAMDIGGQWRSTTSTLFELASHFYEDLLKSVLMTGGLSGEDFQLYRRAMEAVETMRLITRSHVDVFWARDYDLEKGTHERYMRYSGCYLGAMLMLGADVIERRHYLNTEEKRRAIEQAIRHREMAEALTETCYRESNRSQTGLGSAKFYPDGVEDGHFIYKEIENRRFNLSPELAQSYFVLWRTTGDPKYREYAWEMAQAIDRHCRTPNGGFAGLKNVNDTEEGFTNHQPELFLSGTLKYLFLTFSDTKLFPLDQWVFNSAGHPLPICGGHSTYPQSLCKVADFEYKPERKASFLSRKTNKDFKG